METLTTYLETLQKDIQSIEKEESTLSEKINKIEELKNHLQNLSKSPEWPESFVQVNSLAYIPATIIHTGEHYVKLGPQIYTLMSLNETLSFLQRKIHCATKVLDTFKYQRQQLEQRYQISTKVPEDLPETESMPHEITSCKGTALKTNVGLYEVIETYDENEEKAFYEQRQLRKAKQSKHDEKVMQDNEFYFARLDELQQLEDIQNELPVSAHSSYSIDDFSAKEITRGNISERVKNIMKVGDIYNDLLKDDVIQQYYSKNLSEIAEENSTTINEEILNKLIVESLLSEPVSSNLVENSIDFNNKSDTEDKYQNISSNELAAIAFLDAIESNMQNMNI